MFARCSIDNSRHRNSTITAGQTWRISEMGPTTTPPVPHKSEVEAADGITDLQAIRADVLWYAVVCRCAVHPRAMCNQVAEDAWSGALRTEKPAAGQGRTPTLHQLAIRDAGTVWALRSLWHCKSCLPFVVRLQQQMAMVLEKASGHPSYRIVGGQRLFRTFLPKNPEAKDGQHWLYAFRSIAEGTLQSSLGILPNPGQDGQRRTHGDYAEKAADAKGHQLPTHLAARKDHTVTTANCNSKIVSSRVWTCSLNPMFFHLNCQQLMPIFQDCSQQASVKGRCKFSKLQRILELFRTFISCLRRVRQPFLNPFALALAFAT